ncbi:hypothetical protein OIDMADRAFT_31305 [Oidiodendron maius Zn]|uniref:Heterokaryon incompatibility domain-containing protein n=1 Tax=Oidiodendron maius (strain Zn) TaxID=913774 RepID=A0A0C3D9A4_OIDMZ|nr:hypothetical protein OIDMADRAFT_31305 [Oidiodendron maius Zn]
MALSFKQLSSDPKSLRSSFRSLVSRRERIDQVPCVRLGEATNSLSEGSKESLGADQSAGGKSSAPQYQPLYRDLKKQDMIRLIKLDPKAAITHQGYVLKKFRLNRAPKFHALSYCWGSPEISAQIICNGTPLKISIQLHQCIQELQSMPSLARLCDNPSEAAFSLAQKIFEVIQQDTDLLQPTYTKRGMPSLEALFEDDILALGLPSFSDLSWKELKTLLSKPWFSRIWVIQEAVLSINTPLLVHGFKIQSWNHLLWAVLWMGQKIYAANSLGLVATHILPLRNIFTIWNSTRPWGLQALLVASNSCIATDPRDKVFALLGLSAEAQDETSLPPQLIPNYKKPVQQVYLDVTSYIISATRDLILLSLINNDLNLSCSHGGVAIPSWVPQFNCFSSSLGGYKLGLNTDNRIQYKRTRMNATKDVLASIQEQQDVKTLVLQGLKVDMVDWCAERSPTTPEPFMVLRWCEEGAQRLVHSECRTFEQFLKDFLLTTSHVRGLQNPPSVDDFWEYLASEGVSSPNLIYFLRFLQVSNAKEAGDSNCMREIVDWTGLHKRRFFITNTQAIGIGPREIQAGDIIGVIFGGQAPFVLRPCGGHYHLVGECFVIGLMDGEAIDKWKEGQIEPE